MEGKESQRVVPMKDFVYWQETPAHLQPAIGEVHSRHRVLPGRNKIKAVLREENNHTCQHTTQYNYHTREYSHHAALHTEEDATTQPHTEGRNLPNIPPYKKKKRPFIQAYRGLRKQYRIHLPPRKKHPNIHEYTRGED